jgi:hypothetical protein
MDVFPIEIIQEILSHLRPVVSMTRGDRADAKLMYDVWNWWSPRPVFSEYEKSRETLPADPNHFLDVEKVDDHNPRQRYLEILPLRLSVYKPQHIYYMSNGAHRVNRVFKDAFTPFVYQEMALLGWSDETTHYVASQYGSHVHSLRLVFRDMEDDAVQGIPPPQQEDLMKIISLCPNIWSIAFYYFKPPLVGWAYIEPTQMMSALMQLKRLNTVGVYTVGVLDWETERVRLSSHQIGYIGQSDKGALITRLDIVIPLFNKYIHRNLLSGYTSLEHLSIYGSFKRFRAIQPGSLDWSSFLHLTTLSLAGDPVSDRIFSSSIPDLVRTCISLRRLSISDLGTLFESPDPDRTAGWSTQRDSWWNQRIPLEYLQLDIAMRRTALRIGSIPALDMRLVVREDGHFDGLFIEDPEVFPHLQVLTVRSGYVQQKYSSDSDVIWTEPLCRLREERGVTLHFEGIKPVARSKGDNRDCPAMVAS